MKNTILEESYDGLTVLRDSLSSGREIVLSELKFHINFF